MRSKLRFLKSISILTLTVAIIGTTVFSILLNSKLNIYSRADNFVSVDTTPFPVGVNIYTKNIEENPSVDEFFYNTLAGTLNKDGKLENKLAALFSNQSWYQNLGSPTARILVIQPGQRKEEISKNIGDILGWSKSERNKFRELVDTSTPILNEGKYFPGHYVAHRDARPDEVANLIRETFEAKILNHYTEDVEANVPLKNAIIIASLLEREASDFENMREISGVIWNRLFIDMPLQLDATLQYARGNLSYEPRWWPKVNPRDKYIDSPFNTYKNKGLPPAAIANPAPEAILAALNPIKTDCLFYFHSSNSKYHCSETYAGHVAKLRSIYGRGK